MNAATYKPQHVCKVSDLVPDSGVAVLIDELQIALFHFPGQSPSVYAVSNHDPFSNANVIARGIVGDIDNRLVVASPIFKHHFDLESGRCIEDETVTLKTYAVQVIGDDVLLCL